MQPSVFEIVSMERAETKNSNSPMWRCTCKTGERVNVFEHSDPRRDTHHLFKAAGYDPEMAAMTIREILTWQASPIQVLLDKDGDWWKVVDVKPRPAQAAPDSRYKPDLAWYKEKARQEARQLTDDLRAIYFDTETTGTDPEAEIISLAVLDRLGKVIAHTLIKPCDMAKVEQTTFVHQLTPADLANAPDFPTAVGKIAARLNNELWCAYNVDFDARMMEQSLMRHRMKPITPHATIDAMKIYSHFAGLWDVTTQNWKPAKLTDACTSLALPVENAHDAMADAKNLLTLIYRIAD